MAEETKPTAKEETKPTAKEEKPVKKPKEKIQKIKKEQAVARALSVRASKKQCVYICSFIKNKPIDKAISDLEKVIKLKQAIPFKGEIPHRKGMMSGRYPVNASKYFINILKALKGNASVNGLELEKTVIHSASASWASRPARRGGRHAKRTNVVLIAKEKK